MLNQLWDRLVMMQEILWRQYEDIQGTSTHLQFIVPHCFQEDILQHFHAGALEGHLGVEKTVAKIKERFYWPGIWHNVTNWCCTCSTVLLSKPSSLSTQCRWWQWISWVPYRRAQSKSNYCSKKAYQRDVLQVLTS